MPAGGGGRKSAVDRAREFLFRNLFSSLGGVTFGDWMSLLAANSFQIEPRYWPRAMFLTASSIANSFFRRVEEFRFEEAAAREPIPPLLFVLGHWRSGTTLLQNLLATDSRWASINLYQAMYPHTFLTTEGHGRIFGRFLPKSRGVDAMPIGFELAAEDEFALAVLTGFSPYLGWTFPRREREYERYLTLRTVDPEEIRSWQAAFRKLVQKLSLRYGRLPIVLKSPTHTGRVRWLLEAFPSAKFVHIHRHPYEVFSSTVRLVEHGTAGLRLQFPDRSMITEGVLRRYRLLHDAFFEDRKLIPVGRLHEISFSDLEREPLATLEKAYAALDLSPFATARPNVEEYVRLTAGYQKNVYPALDAQDRERVRRAAERCFEQFGYEP